MLSNARIVSHRVRSNIYIYTLLVRAVCYHVFGKGFENVEPSFRLRAPVAAATGSRYRDRFSRATPAVNASPSAFHNRQLVTLNARFFFCGRPDADGYRNTPTFGSGRAVIIGAVDALVRRGPVGEITDDVFTFRSTIRIVECLYDSMRPKKYIPGQWRNERYRKAFRLQPTGTETTGL